MPGAGGALSPRDEDAGRSLALRSARVDPLAPGVRRTPVGRRAHRRAAGAEPRPGAVGPAAREPAGEPARDRRRRGAAGLAARPPRARGDRRHRRLAGPHRRVPVRRLRGRDPAVLRARPVDGRRAAGRPRVRVGGGGRHPRHVARPRGAGGRPAQHLAGGAGARRGRPRHARPGAGGGAAAGVRARGHPAPRGRGGALPDRERAARRARPRGDPDLDPVRGRDAGPRAGTRAGGRTGGRRTGDRAARQPRAARHPRPARPRRAPGRDRRRGLAELTDRATRLGIPTSLTVTGTPWPDAPQHWLAVNRIVQECLTNAGKHAPGEQVAVGVDWAEDGVGVRVTNPRPRWAPQVPDSGCPAWPSAPACWGAPSTAAATAALHRDRVAPRDGGATAVTSVLLADDQAMVRSGLRMILELRGLDVVGEAADGAEAAVLAAELEPDVVLMDVRMPGTDGIEGLRRIVAAGLPCRVVVLTTFDLDQHVYDALRAGAAGFLLKDASAEQLVGAVERRPRVRCRWRRR